MTDPRKFTNEEIAMLAECERNMDSGAQPFVILDRQRCAVPPETMESLGLVSGQTINGQIFTAILETNIASLEALIALDKITAPAAH